MLTQITQYNDLRKKVSFFVNKLSIGRQLNKVDRKLIIPLTDILTTALFKHLDQIQTKKELWKLLKLPRAYKTLVVNLNRFSWLALKILLVLLRFNHLTPHLVKRIDSTDIPVCSNRKAKYHHIMRQFAAWGKTGKGWLFMG